MWAGLEEEIHKDIRGIIEFLGNDVCVGGC